MNVSVKAVYDQLQQRGIDVQIVRMSGDRTLLLFSYGDSVRAIRGTTADLTTATAVMIADDKQTAAAFAERLGIPLPATIEYTEISQAEQLLEQHGTLVVKPLNAAHGNGVTTGITSREALLRAVDRAQAFSPIVLVQQQVSGSDIRILVIDGEPVAIAERVPAAVVGDGEHTIKELIEIENTTNPNRGVNYEKPLNIISIDGSEAFLGEKLHDIPESGKSVQVVGTANQGTGGTVVDRTNDPTIPQALIDHAVLFSTQAGLFCSGIDFIFDQEAQTWQFIEANASPSFSVHWYPVNGDRRDVTPTFVGKLLARYNSLSNE